MSRWTRWLGTSAVFLLALVRSTAAIDYPGGWNPQHTQCVDICTHANPAPTCFDADPACRAKTQSPGDFDYLVLEQLFLPQFCRLLLLGVDPTLSHRNVAPFPHGVQCAQQVIDQLQEDRNVLTIHGLWPNYWHGFPACCNASADAARNHPFDPIGLADTHRGLLQEMGAKWIDPVQSKPMETRCDLYNHEFQKHGLCWANYRAQGYIAAAARYFRATLRLADTLKTPTVAIQRMFGQQVRLTDLQQLYQQRVQILCSPCELGQCLLSVRSCFQQVGDDPRQLQAMDCPESAPGGPYRLCQATSLIALAPYVLVQSVD